MYAEEKGKRSLELCEGQLYLSASRQLDGAACTRGRIADDAQAWGFQLRGETAMKKQLLRPLRQRMELLSHETEMRPAKEIRDSEMGEILRRFLDGGAEGDLALRLYVRIEYQKESSAL